MFPVINGPNIFMSRNHFSFRFSSHFPRLILFQFRNIISFVRFFGPFDEWPHYGLRKRSKLEKEAKWKMRASIDCLACRVGRHVKKGRMNIISCVTCYRWIWIIYKLVGLVDFQNSSSKADSSSRVLVARPKRIKLGGNSGNQSRDFITLYRIYF